MPISMIARLSLAAALGLPAAASAQVCQFEHVPAVPSGQFSNQFFDIAGLASDGVWAVGRATFGALPVLESRTLIERFDGATWHLMTTPSPGTSSVLYGVAAASTNQAWAVGSYNPLSPPTRALVLKWDGAAWSQHLAPQVPEGGIELLDAAWIGGELWVSGWRFSQLPPPAAGGYPLVAIWDGAQWRENSPPPLATTGGDSFNELAAISGTGPSDVWAVGVAHGRGEFGPTRYVTHFNGQDWTIDLSVPVPNPDFTIINDVVAVAPDDVWIVGYYNAANTNQPYIAHYNGTGWTQETLPTYPAQGAILRAVTARSSTEVYAAGLVADAAGYPSPLMLRFDGVSWQEMVFAPTDGVNEQFHAMTTLPSGEVWAAGQYFTNHKAPLAMRLACEASCYPNCDASTGSPLLTANDFQCFLNRFAAADPYANCDGSTGSPALTANDFQCFLNAYAAGCT